MSAFSVDEFLWTCLDLDGECMQISLKKLTELCAQILIDDTLLLTSNVPKLPNQIHALLLSSAIAQNKFFSIKILMQWCPYERIELPIPSILKSLRIIPERNGTEIKNAYKNFIEKASEMLSVFFDLIQNHRDSQLHYLDFGTIPVGVKILIQIKSFLSRISVLTEQYTLACTVVINRSTELYQLICCIQQAKVLGINLVINGIFFFNNTYAEVSVINAFEHLSEKDVQLMAFSFSTVVPSTEPMYDSLCSFKFLKYLDMTRLSNAVITETSFRALASALAEFPSLERLVLKGIALTGRLSDLFVEFCKQDHKDTNSNCIVQNGTLEFLDISACSLAGSDIEILRKLALKNSLKYLNISDNSLEMNSTCETLLSLKSSLRILEMNHCFQGRVDYNPKIFPLSEFRNLQYLSMKGLNVNPDSVSMVEYELPNLAVIIT